MRLVVACLQLDLDQLSLGVLQEQIVDLLRADFLGGCCCAKINAWRFVASTAQKCDALQIGAASVRANHTLLNLCSVNALKRKQCAAHVVEDLLRIAVEGIDLVAQLDECHNRIRINLRAAVL